MDEGDYRGHRTMFLLGTPKEESLKDDLDDRKRLLYQVAVRFDKEDYARLLAEARGDKRPVSDFCRLLLLWGIQWYEEAGSFRELDKHKPPGKSKRSNG